MLIPYLKKQRNILLNLFYEIFKNSKKKEKKCYLRESNPGVRTQISDIENPILHYLKRPMAICNKGDTVIFVKCARKDMEQRSWIRDYTKQMGQKGIVFDEMSSLLNKFLIFGKYI